MLIPNDMSLTKLCLDLSLFKANNLCAATSLRHPATLYRAPIDSTSAASWKGSVLLRGEYCRESPFDIDCARCLDRSR